MRKRRCAASFPQTTLGSLRRLFCRGATGLSVGLTLSAGAADWTIEDLGGRSAQYSAAYSINHRGQVTGSTYSQDKWRAFFFDGTRPLRFIGTLPGMTSSEGYGINGSGQIVGTSGDNSEGLWHAVLFDPSRGLIDLDPTGIFSNASHASGINSAGLIVGGGYPSTVPPSETSAPDGCPETYPLGGSPRAILWNGMYDLGSLPSFFSSSTATAINDHGLIVGWSSAEPPGPYYHLEPDPRGPDFPPVVVCDIPSFVMHAAYHYGGQWYDLGTLGGTFSSANSVNSRGQIVGGSAVQGDVAHHAFLFDRGLMHDIHPPNWRNSVAIGINNDGLIVGTVDNGWIPSGFFYDGVARDINGFPEVIAAGWSITGAYAINDTGQIVGVGVNGNNQSHAYRLHPQSTSRYMQTVDVDTLYNFGCSQTNQRGIVVLAFGRPVVRRQGNQGTRYGATLFRANGFAQVSAIEEAVQAFLDGYYVCHGRPGFGTLTVAVGTSSHGTDVGREHGQAWGAMLARLNDYLVSSGYTDRLSVVGAIDIEQGKRGDADGWSSPSLARAWVDGYASTSRGVGYINYGSADGCPTRGAGPCNNGWTQDDVIYVSWGNTASIGPVPQIYFNVPPGRPSNALQWATLATRGAGRPRFFPGSMTQWQACRDRPRSCPNPTNTTVQGWQQLMDALHDASPDLAPLVQRKLYSTDITWN